MIDSTGEFGNYDIVQNDVMSMTRQLLTTDGPESIYSSTVSELNVTYNASQGQDQSYNAPYSVPSTITIVLLSLCASMITVRVFQVSRNHRLVNSGCTSTYRYLNISAGSGPFGDQ